jgi:hypothetical protein
LETIIYQINQDSDQLQLHTSSDHYPVPAHYFIDNVYSPGFVPTETGMLKSVYLNREFSPNEIMDHHVDIKENCRRLHLVKFFNEHRSKDNFLRVILNRSSKHISFEKDANNVLNIYSIQMLYRLISLLSENEAVQT